MVGIPATLAIGAVVYALIEWMSRDSADAQTIDKQLAQANQDSPGALVPGEAELLTRRIAESERSIVNAALVLIALTAASVYMFGLWALGLPALAWLLTKQVRRL